MKLHRRQFVLGPEAVRPGDDWVATPVAGFGWLSRCPLLPAEKVLDRDGTEWWLLGSAWSEPAPAEQIAAARTADVPALHRRWAGRWLLVGDGRVHMDAAGLLGCFVRERWVSSSAALLARGDAAALARLRFQIGLDWYPLPLSRFASIRRLMPSQVLAADGRIEPRRLLGDAAPRDEEAVLRDLEEYLVGTVRAASRTGRLHVPLTAGYDSRLVLAAIHAAKVPARAFTQSYPAMTGGDRDLPPRLAQAVGCEHVSVPWGAAEPARYDAFDAHTGGHCSESDREFFARGMWDWCEEGDVVLRGGCFEVGRWGFTAELGEGPFELATILRAFPVQNGASRDALGEWIAWCREHPEPLDWRDRFYWEQRLGGWLATVEQALDLLRGTRGHVANSLRFYELALSLSPETRKTSRHHVALIRRLAPGLLAYPFNPRDSLAARLRKKALHKLRKWFWRLATTSS